jgi:NAD(P)-dependent dehydrogenase (short-subunit alcohol dehydrogenase family)
VVLCDNRPGAAEEASRSLRVHGYPADARTVDVRDAAAIDRMVVAVLASHRCVDVLVNNAGWPSSSPPRR